MFVLILCGGWFEVSCLWTCLVLPGGNLLHRLLWAFCRYVGVGCNSVCYSRGLMFLYAQMFKLECVVGEFLVS